MKKELLELRQAYQDTDQGNPTMQKILKKYIL